MRFTVYWGAAIFDMIIPLKECLNTCDTRSNVPKRLLNSIRLGINKSLTKLNAILLLKFFCHFTINEIRWELDTHIYWHAARQWLIPCSRTVAVSAYTLGFAACVYSRLTPMLHLIAYEKKVRPFLNTLRICAVEMWAKNHFNHRAQPLAWKFYSKIRIKVLMLSLIHI